MKKTFHKLISAALAVCLAVSMAAQTATPASANPIVDTLTEKAVDKLIETGMRVCSEGLNELGEATGNSGHPGTAEAISFINDWVFTDGTDKELAKIQELCEEILDELDAIDTRMTASFSVIESVLGNTNISTAKNNVDAKWTNDVDNVITTYRANTPLVRYQQYLTDAVNGASQDVLEKDLNALISGYSNMYSGTISVSQSDTESLKQILFEDSNMNRSFESLIDQLSINLLGNDITTANAATYAAKFAYQAFPFSHQQYEYVYCAMEKQIMQVMLVEMMYNEYLFQQGEYFKEKYGTDSDYYRGYEGYQSSFFDLMTDGDNCVNSRIEKMLDAKMTVDDASGLKLALADYMKPEDACQVTLSINGYVSEFNFSDEVAEELQEIPRLHIRDKSNIAHAEYIGRQVICRRVMTQNSSGDHIYYILDPEQFKGTDALYVCSLDHKIDLSIDGDVHTPSCDYVNLCKEMSDGVNTYQGITDLSCSSVADLFDNNYFLACGSKIEDFLAGAGNYLPNKDTNPTTKGNYIITSIYRYDPWALINTSYTNFKVIDASEPYTGTISLSSKDGKDELDMDDYQKSKDYTFSTILAKKSGGSYSQKVAASMNDPTLGAIEITTPDGKKINYGGSMNVASGTPLKVRMYASVGRPIGLNLYRSNGTRTSEFLLKQSDFSVLPTDDDGFYEFNFEMPYSDCTFEFDVDNTLNSVTLNSGANGSLQFADRSSTVLKMFYPDETVVFYATPADGYAVESINYLDAASGVILGSFDVTGDGSELECSFAMPSQNVVVRASFVKRRAEKITIDSYEKLCAFRDLVNSDYSVYGDVEAEISANILVPDDAVWTRGIGSVEDAKPFNGTLYGNGYAIIGLNVECGEYGGLFEYIGKNGVVTDLHVIDCDFSTNANTTTAGGIAARNDGTIDHCTSGVNLNPQKKITLPNGNRVKVADYNSFVMATIAGGIAGENRGTITGSRSGAVVTGSQCGGIAGYNMGTIYGCASNGPSGSSSTVCTLSGGIAGTNEGTIASSYNSGNVLSGKTDRIGSIAGSNRSANVNDTFYSNVNQIPVVGSTSTQQAAASCSMVENTDMVKLPFVDTMNSVTDDSILWVQATFGDLCFNRGYPTIRGRFIEERAVEAANGILVKGLMHEGLNVSYAKLDSSSDEYKSFGVVSQSASFTAYGVQLTDDSGNYVPGELWASGVQISVPVDGDSAIYAIDDDGKAVEITPDSIENGVATFTAAEPVTFATVKKTDASKNDSSKADTSKADSSSSQVKSPKTATLAEDSGSRIVLPTAIIPIILALALVFKRKRRT